MFDILFKDFNGLRINTLIETVIGAAFIGIASSILFLNDASSGGTDILALIVTNYTDADISKAMFMTDITIVLLSVFVYGFAGLIMSFIGFALKLLTIKLFEKNLI